MTFQDDRFYFAFHLPLGHSWSEIAFLLFSRLNPLYVALMHCVVTAGPTHEPLDRVRRLTNLSTGKLGTRLANFLSAQGHQTTLLLGEGATFREAAPAVAVQSFTSTADLRERLRPLSTLSIDAVFHAAAVSDFSFGKIWRRSPEGEMTQVSSGKFSTEEGTLLAELVPTPKIIGWLREWFPAACLVGWKYEVDGDRASVIAKAQQQIATCMTSACVGNGPAYGFGFGLVTAREAVHFSDTTELYRALESLCLQAAAMPPGAQSSSSAQ